MTKLTLSFALAILAIAPIARVARASDPVLAAKLFEEGRAAVDRGDLDEGCAKLTLSLQRDPRVGTLGKLAECEEKRGRSATARARWQEAVDLAQLTSDPRRAAAEVELARLDRTVPKLSVRLGGKAPNERVRIDGRATTDVGSSPVPADPGEHVVEASADGFAPWSSRVRLAADGKVIVVDVPMLAPVTEPPPSAPHNLPLPPTADRATESAKSAPRSPLRAIGITTAGAGAVALGIGAYFTAQAASLKTRSNAAGGCLGNVCSASAATMRRDAFSDGNVATVLFAGGGAMALTGAALGLLGPRKASSATGIHVTPTAGPKTAGVLLGGSF